MAALAWIGWASCSAEVPCLDGGDAGVIFIDGGGFYPDSADGFVPVECRSPGPPPAPTLVPIWNGCSMVTCSCYCTGAVGVEGMCCWAPCHNPDGGGTCP